MGGALPPPLGWAPDVGDGGSDQWLVGEAVYVSSCQHPKKIWKENYVVWTALEPWLNAFTCMPLTRVFQVVLRGRVFQIAVRDGGNLSTGGIRNFASCEYWTSIKIKISMTCVSKEYESKTKNVFIG